VLAVSSELGVDTARAAVDLLRRNPGRYNYARSGAGTVAHLSMELIKARTGTFIVHVPYNASPAAVLSILQGDTHMASLAPLAVIPQVKAGKLQRARGDHARAHAASCPTCRPSARPGSPTSRPPRGSASSCRPARRTPIVERLNREIVAVLKSPATAEQLRACLMDPVAGTPQQFGAFMQEELRRWKPVIERAGVALE
jgi:tripartite-type tricarboxylate transporter receptor subunit TctC